MKKLTALISAALLLLGLSPCAFAASILEKPTEGQVVFIEADNHLDYEAAFPLAAMTGAYREADDLYLEFPAARMTLKGFFAPLGEWRGISFSDGGRLGGAAFDDSGRFTGQFHSVSIMGKNSGLRKLEALLSDQRPALAQAQLSPYGTTVLIDGEVAAWDVAKLCLESVELISPKDKTNWQTVKSQRFEFIYNDDGSFTPVRAYIEFINGISTATLNSRCVYMEESLIMRPISAGRAVVSFQNRRGEELMRLDVLCSEDENGALQISSQCPGCNDMQGEALHFLPCGHFSCAEGHDESEHEIAPCAVAGHCVSENEHEMCTNCREYTCDGQSHGIGYCQHTHNWMPISKNSSRCVNCGYVYTSG